MKYIQFLLRQLSLFISALLGWYEGSKQVRIEMIGMIIDIFRTIKKAEDAIDTTKTEVNKRISKDCKVKTGSDFATENINYYLAFVFSASVVRLHTSCLI